MQLFLPFCRQGLHRDFRLHRDFQALAKKWVLCSDGISPAQGTEQSALVSMLLPRKVVLASC